MKIYSRENVLEAALRRIRWLYDEFPNVVVAFSGGKDSTVVLNLAIMVAREKGRLPVTAIWIDQEAEWAAVVDYQRYTHQRPEVRHWWFQIPVDIENGSTHDAKDSMVHLWGPGEPWMRAKEPAGTITDEDFGTKSVFELFDAIVGRRFAGQKACMLGGIRCEESPARTAGLTTSATYKTATWGKRLSGGSQHYTMYPIYDWTWRDVWKAIHQHGWRYCKLYDWMFQHGVPVRDMRVSNIHHETALSHLHYLHEFEADTWNRLAKRVPGVNTVKQLASDFCPKDLPPMFGSWLEYRDYLLANLVTDPVGRAKFAKRFAAMDRTYAGMQALDRMYRAQIQAVLVNDHLGIKLNVWECNPAVAAWKQWKNGKRHPSQAGNPFIYGEKTKP